MNGGRGTTDAVAQGRAFGFCSSEVVVSTIGATPTGSETSTALRYFNFRKATIYAGSNEIQKNIIAKHVLGL